MGSHRFLQHVCEAMEVVGGDVLQGQRFISIVIYGRRHVLKVRVQGTSKFRIYPVKVYI